MIEVRDAFRIYESAAGGTVALQGLKLTVERGEIVVVLGPSGSGKTTLLRVLAGLERLSAGGGSVLGTPLRDIDDAFRARNLGLLDQHYARSLSADLTCRQTVGLQLGLLGHDPHQAGRAAEDLLGQVALADRADDRPGSLSGGEQQRVAVCAAVAHRPGLLLADEPAGELDSENAATVYRLLGELVRGSGATALIVSHDAHAASIADRLVYVRDGRVVAQARPGQDPAFAVTHGWVRLPDAALAQTGRPSLVTIEAAGGRLVLQPMDSTPAAAVDGDVMAAAAGPVVAAVEAVEKRYGTRIVLDGLSRGFRAGALTAVVGRSGSGKTTLLHLLAGLERPSAGDVTLAGDSLGGLTRAKLAGLRRRHVALVTQEPGLVPYLNALENVELALHLRGADGGAREALVQVGLEHHLDLPAARLSAGERQRVAIARALAARTRLLLVDEPTARLDEENARSTGALLARAAHEHGVAVVCATHDSVLIEQADETINLDGEPVPSTPS
ncbi:MAG: ABC transporter ATP-binding protein [Actinobacteria bacterium]|nr:MAG: ABC transporter ATP-binding protein [Actinomycetota bacterium]